MPAPKQTKFQPRTKAQNSAIHALLGKFSFTSDDKAEMVFDITQGRTEHTSEMSFDEANRMIHRLGGQPFGNSSDASRRTVQNRRRKAGVATLATPTHLDFMNRLRRGRGMSDEAFKDFCFRIIHKDRPVTTKETNKIIEALKSMNRRDKEAAAKEAA